MKRALKAHLRDVLAIIALVLAGLFAVTVILINQRASLPNWVPVIGTDFFHLEADFSTAQAVTPGQGQSVDIAGIKVGQISGVKLEDGHAVVSMSIDNKYAPLIHDDASLLLRPKTGLNDMVAEVDPGTQSSPDIKEDSTVPLASTQPQVNPDEFLATLDADTQTFLKLLLSNGAEARSSRPRREALQCPAASRSVRPEHLRDLGGSGGTPGEHRQLDPQLPALCRPSSGTAIRTWSTSSTPRTRRSPRSRRRRPRFAAPSRAAGDAQGDEGALTSANALALQSGPALKKSIPGPRRRARRPRPPAVLPADRRSDREPDPAVHHAGRQSRHAHRADLAGPRHRDAELEDRIH
jgi:hypothetical protein